MAFYSACSSAQRNAIGDAFDAAIAVAAQAVATYMALVQDASQDPSCVPRWRGAAESAQADLSLLNNQYNAFLHGSPLGDVAPPDPTVVAQVQAISTQLAAVIVTANDDSDVISLLTQALQIIAEL